MSSRPFASETSSLQCPMWLGKSASDSTTAYGPNPLAHHHPSIIGAALTCGASLSLVLAALLLLLS